MKNTCRAWGIFTLVQASVCLAVYGSALWGMRLLAPIDIGPAVFPAYKFVDPNSDGVPDNHYIIDQLIYDLPLQTVIYDAYRRGEIPWWDPYTYGGRPLLADAHINGTDPIRIFCYLTLPFALAYNWNLVLHSLVAAAAMFALLRFWRFGLFTCTTLAIAWQFSGAFVMHFGHPWIAGTFVWFPLIWICWERAWSVGSLSVRSTVLAGFLCGASFYSGNLQSHIYLPLFALAFLLGHLSLNWQANFRAVFVIATSGVLGAALASPVLANQVEFFLLSTREVAPDLEWWKHPAKGLLSLAGVFPWATGTFRTFDIGRIVKSSGASWLLFCGSATFLLAILGLFSRGEISDRQRRLWKTSVALVSIYLIIAVTPLAQIFYLRIAPLAVLGIVPLAAIGLQLLTSAAWIPKGKAALATGIVALAMVLVVNIMALLVFPHLKDRVTQAALSADSSNKSFPAGAPALRVFQVESLPAEVSFLNPETTLSLSGLLLLSAALGAASQTQRRLLTGSAVVVSLLPVLNFAGRFIPDHPTEMLRRLQAGGPAQRQAVDLVAENHGRLLDRDTQIFPYAMGALYRTHTVHGYSALQPPGIFNRQTGSSHPEEFGADFAVRLRTEGGSPLEIEPLSTHPPMARFLCSHGTFISVQSETLNSLVLSFSKTFPDSFLRTDTPYPGWELSPDSGFTMSQEGLATVIESTGERPHREVQLLYRPTHLTNTTVMALSAAVLALAATLFQNWRIVCPERNVAKRTELPVEAARLAG